MGQVVGRKGTIYRWGSGDEFIICLPDFSTIEAQATAERIRSAIEQAGPGGDIEVTTSIGVCGTDCSESNNPETILNFADKALYESKHSRGKNCVTAWPLSPAEATVEIKPTKRLGEQERQKLAKSVVLSIKTDSGHDRNYIVRIKNYSKDHDAAIKSISLWSDGHRVGAPVFSPEGDGAKRWKAETNRELTINFDAGEVVAQRLWSIEGSPSKSAYHDSNLLMGHFRSKVRVEVSYEVLEVAMEYAEAHKVQVDPINNTVTPV